jgi:hypothetical protein
MCVGPEILQGSPRQAKSKLSILKMSYAAAKNPHFARNLNEISSDVLPRVNYHWIDQNITNARNNTKCPRDAYDYLTQISYSDHMPDKRMNVHINRVQVPIEQRI